MASPVVAAAAAIVRREYPDTSKYSSRFIMGQLSSATKDQVLYKDENGGIHNYKKLNILDSLTLLPKPALGISNVSLFDGTDLSENNNNDGIVQAGETIDIGFLISNRWGIAKDVSISVDAKSSGGVDNPYVQFIVNKIDIDNEIGTFATVNNGYKYNMDEIIGIDHPIRLKISEDAPNDLMVTLNYEVTAKNGMDSSDSSVYGFYGNKSLSYTFTVQKGRILRGIIKSDMTLSPDEYWIVQNNVLIPEGVTVTVDPGTQIQFWSSEANGIYEDQQDPYIMVEGTLKCNGTVDQPIEMFPGKGYEDKGVLVFGDQVELSYVNILNPDYRQNEINRYRFKVKTIDHCTLTNDREQYGYKVGSFIEAESITNTKINSLGNTVSNGFIQYGEENLKTSVLDTCFIQGCELAWANSLNSQIEKNVFQRNKVSSFKNLNYVDNKTFNKNAILNSFYDYSKDKDFYITTNKGHEDIDISNNYWGTDNKNLARLQVLDADSDVSLNDLIQEPLLVSTSDMSDIYPFVVDAYITDLTGENRLSQVVNSQTVQVHVKFNRDMSQDAKYEPMVSFGPAEPYTDYMVKGDWASAREWVGTIKIDPLINQGTEYFRIKDAAAADDLWLTTGTDAARFSFDITKSSAEALTLQGAGGSNENNLNWVQDDYDTLAGYNLYRATEYDSSKSIEEQGFKKINTSIIANSTKEYTDTDVEQGREYYYYFTVVDTQFAESPASNIVKCIPLDEEKPVIRTRAIETRTVGTAVTVSADIIDNVEVKQGTLYYKSSGDESWKNIKMRNTSGDTYQAVIPAYDIKEGTMHYYVSATDGTNTITAGSAEVSGVFWVIGIVDVESITLDHTAKDIALGDSFQLEAAVLPENATDQSVTWSSSDESIATVDDKGKVTAVIVGEATITARSKDGKKSAACNITVKPILVTGFSIEPESKTVLVEDTFTIVPTVLPGNATNKAVNYESSDTKVVTVDADGKVLAVGAGEADIIISTADDSDLSKICRVTVNPIKVKSVSVSESSKTLNVGDVFTLTANMYPENATDQEAIWTSSAPEVANVVDGKVTALKGGKTTITVETKDGGVKAICNVTVNRILTTDIMLSKDELILDVGDSETLTVEVDPADATSNTFIWKTDNKDIAAVKDGKITAVGVGKTFIKCVTDDGTDITKICSVEVYDKFAKPAKPVVQSKSLTSVTLKAVAGALYSKDGTNWTESNEFTGLTENTEYSFYIKLKADGYYHESDASDAALVKTDESTILVTGMELDKSSLELMVNDTAKLTAIVEPDRPSAPEMNWISTNTSVAAVDNSGNITAKAIGLTFIMCKSTDGSDKTAICAVKVYDQYDAPETIEVDAVTGNRIAIKAVNGCEYRIGTGNWSDSAEFTGLETNTEYEIGVRRAANGYHKASEVKTIKLKTLDPVNDQEKTDADSAESGKPSKQDTTEDGTSSGQAAGTTESGQPVEQGTTESGQPAEQGTTESGQPAEQGTIESGQPAEQGTTESGQPAEQGTTEDGTSSGQNAGTTESGQPAEQGTTGSVQPAEQGTTGSVQPVEQDTTEIEQPAEQGTTEIGQPAEQGTTESVQPAEQGTTESGRPAEQGTTESGQPVEQGTTEDGTSSGQAVGTTEQAAAEAGSILQDTQGIRYKVILITDAKSTVAYEKPAAGTSGTVVIPDEVTIDGITYKVTTIAEGAFRNNKQITKVVIGKNVKGIGEKAFYGCTKLKTVSMGKQVESFGNQAFARCTSLTKFTVPASVKKLGKKVWSGCTKLKTLTVKSTALTAKTVSKNAFGGISAKTTVKVPKKMKKKYEELFRKKGLAKKAGIRS